MPANELSLIVQFDARSANRSVDKFNRNLSGIERTAGKATAGATRGIKNFERATVRATAKMSSSISALSGKFQMLAGVGFAALGVAAVKVAADFQRAQIGMGALLGSVAEGNKLFKEVQQFAMTSPFTFKELIIAANRLAAVNFETKEILPTLKAMSTAVAALGGSGQRLNDLIRALGDVKAAGKLTGEEARQFKNAAIPYQKFLAEAFKVPMSEVKKAIEEGRLGADETIRAMIAGMEKQFGKFGEVIEKTASVAFANFVDALQKLSDEVLRADFLPWLTGKINDLRASFEVAAEWIDKNRDGLIKLADVIKKIGVVFITYKIVQQFQALALALKAVSLSNPWTAIATGLGIIAFESHKMKKGLDEAYDSLERAERLRDIRLGKGLNLETYQELGYTLEEVKAAFSGMRTIEEQDFSGLDHGLKVTFKGMKDTADATYEFTENLDKLKKQIASMEKRATGILNTANRKDADGIARVIVMHKQYQAELGTSEKARKSLAAAMKISLGTEQRKLGEQTYKDFQKLAEQQLKDTLKIQTREFRAQQEFEADTIEMRLATLDEQAAAEQGAARHVRDIRMAQLDGVEAQTVQQQLAIVKQRMGVELEYINELERLQIAEIQRRYQRELVYAQALATLHPEQAALNAERIVAINEAMDAQIGAAAKGAARDRQTNEIEAGRQSARVIMSNTQRTFQQLKSSAGRVFDALLHKSESVWDALANSLKTAVLTALKEIVTSQIALAFTRLMTGQPGTMVSSNPSGGPLGKFAAVLGALGMGGQPVFGGIPGAPGGTGGFAGPVAGLGGMAMGGLFGGGAAAASAGGMLAPGMIGMTGGGAAVGIAGSSAGLFGGVGAGVMGALAAVPIWGWAAIGGAIGGAFLLKKLFGKAKDNVRTKIKNAYGVDIHEKEVIEQITAIIKSQYGGNVTLGIASPQVKDLVEMYAMQTGQSYGGSPTAPRPATLIQSGGVISGVSSIGTSINIGGAAPTAAPVAVLDSRATKEFWNDVVNEGIVRNPRSVQSASLQAQGQNYGRREAAVRQLQPGLVTA